MFQSSAANSANKIHMNDSQPQWLTGLITTKYKSKRPMWATSGSTKAEEPATLLKMAQQVLQKLLNAPQPGQCHGTGLLTVTNDCLQAESNKRLETRDNYTEIHWTVTSLQGQKSNNSYSKHKWGVYTQDFQTDTCKINKSQTHWQNLRHKVRASPSYREGG